MHHDVRPAEHGQEKVCHEEKTNAPSSPLWNFIMGLRCHSSFLLSTFREGNRCVYRSLATSEFRESQRLNAQMLPKTVSPRRHSDQQLETIVCFAAPSCRSPESHCGEQHIVLYTVHFVLGFMVTLYLPVGQKKEKDETFLFLCCIPPANEKERDGGFCRGCDIEL